MSISSARLIFIFAHAYARRYQNRPGTTAHYYSTVSGIAEYRIIISARVHIRTHTVYYVARAFLRVNTNDRLLYHSTVYLSISEGLLLYPVHVNRFLFFKYLHGVTAPDTES